MSGALGVRVCTPMMLAGHDLPDVRLPISLQYVSMILYYESLFIARLRKHAAHS